MCEYVHNEVQFFFFYKIFSQRAPDVTEGVNARRSYGRWIRVTREKERERGGSRNRRQIEWTHGRRLDIRARPLNSNLFLSSRNSRWSEF